MKAVNVVEEVAVIGSPGLKAERVQLTAAKAQKSTRQSPTRRR